VALTRSILRTRPLLAAVLCLLLALGISGTWSTLASATPADPTPTTSADARVQLEKVSREKEALTEKYNLAQAQVQAKQQAAAAAKRAADTAMANYLTSREQLRQIVSARYEGSAFSSTGALLTSDSTQNYVNRMSQLNLLSAHRGTLVAQLDAAKAKADAAQQQAAKLLAQANAQLADVSKQRDVILAQVQKFKDLVAKLSAQELAAYKAAHTPPAPQIRAAVAPATTPTTTATPAPKPSTVVSGSLSAKQKIVVDYVVAQVGKCYVFAGTGPDCYDCSGLAMMAYEQVGISLPHNALTQYNYGTHVSSSELQPGDLVFLYQPIGHVEIYIGNGVAVSAADEELGIRYVNVFDDMADYTGATRLL
jgi:peptidoglycan DL-endopeptidase CwlO